MWKRFLRSEKILLSGFLLCYNMEFKWQHFKDTCDHCGDGAEVYTTTGRHNCAYDGDKARCVSCGLPGVVMIGDDLMNTPDNRIIWHNEADCDCEWCKINLDCDCEWCKINLNNMIHLTEPHPPIGLTPRLFWLENRAKEIYEACIRYYKAGHTVPQEWFVEHNLVWDEINKEKRKLGV